MYLTPSLFGSENIDRQSLLEYTTILFDRQPIIAFNDPSESFGRKEYLKDQGLVKVTGDSVFTESGRGR